MGAVSRKMIESIVMVRFVFEYVYVGVKLFFKIISVSSLLYLFFKNININTYFLIIIII